MRRVLLLALVLVAASVVLPSRATAQGPSWRPPSRDMPTMPRTGELRGWISSRATWFQGVDGISGVAASGLQASGEPRPGTDFVQIARFSSGPVPVVVWSDRNGDSRADMIEIFRSGGVIIQLIDADYDGGANVVRVYDSSGTLIRQDRL